MNMEVEQPMIFSEAGAAMFRGMASLLLGHFRKMVICVQYNNYHMNTIFSDIDLIVSTLLTEIYDAYAAIG
jgi:hypothetical protein